MAIPRFFDNPWFKGVCALRSFVHTSQMLATLHISTVHLTLRPVRPTDRADLMALESDPEVMRYLNGGLVIPEAGHNDADFLTPHGEEPEVVAAHHKESGAFIGWFALFDDGEVEGLRTAEIGYRLIKSAWGKGYGTEGVRALLDFAFNSLGLDRVSAETMAVNHASRRVLEKAGFRHTNCEAIARLAVLRPQSRRAAGHLAEPLRLGPGSQPDVVLAGRRAV